MVDQAHEEEIAKLNHHSSQMNLAAKVIELNLVLMKEDLSEEQQQRTLRMLQQYEELLLS